MIVYNETTMNLWRKKVTKKPVESTPSPAKPVIAVKYDGKLYSTFQEAESARAKADLLSILMPARTITYDMTEFAHRGGVEHAIDESIKNAERVHGILSRYLDAAKIETPKSV